MTKGFVYLIEETDGATGQLTGYYKIGKTTNLDSRIRAFRTASKNGLEYRKTIEVDDYSEAETAAHKTFSPYRMPGENGGKEWFDFRGQDINRIENLLGIIESKYPAYYQPEPEYNEPVTRYRSSYSESFFSISGCAQYLVGLVLLLGVLALAQGGGNYEVMAGDTLSKLEREHGLPPGELRRQNPGINPDELQPGQKLKLPTPPAEPKPEKPNDSHRIDAGGAGILVRVFNSPTQQQTEIKQLPHGTPVQVFAIFEGWGRTQHGWVHLSQIKP